MNLIEGKNREIRRIFKFYNLKVLKLKRIEYGPFKIMKLTDGQIYMVNQSMQKKNFHERHVWFRATGVVAPPRRSSAAR